MYEIIVRSAMDGQINKVIRGTNVGLMDEKFNAIAKLGYPVALVHSSAWESLKEANQELLAKFG